MQSFPITRMYESVSERSKIVDDGTKNNCNNEQDCVELSVPRGVGGVMMLSSRWWTRSHDNGGGHATRNGSRFAPKEGVSRQNGYSLETSFSTHTVQSQAQDTPNAQEAQGHIKKSPWSYRWVSLFSRVNKESQTCPHFTILHHLNIRP